MRKLTRKETAEQDGDVDDDDANDCVGEGRDTEDTPPDVVIVVGEH